MSEEYNACVKIYVYICKDIQAKPIIIYSVQLVNTAALG